MSLRPSPGSPSTARHRSRWLWRRARRLLLAIATASVVGGCGQGRAPERVTATPVAAPVIAIREPMPAAAAHFAPIETAPPAARGCLAAADVPAMRAAALQRWIDAAGITHYSDQPAPASARDRHVIGPERPPPIVVQASGYDVGLPDRLQPRAVAAALGVQQALRDSLGVAPAAATHLRIVFVRDPAAYARLIGDSALATSAGAYAAAQHTIYVRVQEPDAADFTILRHEITHALLHASIGNLPTPLGEGLAEYFARDRVAGSSGRIGIADRAALAEAAPDGDGRDALVDLLARDGAAFYASGEGGAGRVRRYARAYALVAVLMQDGAGRSALAAVLAAQHADPCRAVAAERILDAHVGGGLPALAATWAAFMRSPPAAVPAS